MLLGNDKLYHFVAGLIISLVFSFVFNPLYGVILSIIAGILKEIYDYFDYGTFDIYDMLATWMGGIVGYLLRGVITWLLVGIIR